MVFRNRLAIGICVAAFTGCAVAPEAINVEGVTLSPDASFSLVDARSMENLRGGRNENSYSVWWVYGDDQISPVPMALIRSGLMRSLDRQLAGKLIKVEKFEVSLTRLKATPRTGQVYAPSSGSVGADILGGLLANVLINAIEGSKNGPTIATEIVMDIDGKRIEHAERDFQVSGELDRLLAANMVKAVDGAAVKIAELLKPKVEVSAESKEKP